MSDTLEAYRHSGKFKFSAVAFCLGSAAVAGFPLGLAYAYFTSWVPFIYFNMLATVAYGFAFGWLATRILKSGQVRHAGVAGCCGLGAGLLALYFEWSGHVHVLYEDAPWFLGPDQILGAMGYLYEHGSWGMTKGENFTGIPLALVWAAEAVIIVGAAAWVPYAFIKDTPFCEKTRCWLDEQKKIDTLETIADPAQLAALQSGDIMPVVSARPRAETAASFTRLLLKRSPRCKVFCTLRVQGITLVTDKKGNVTEKVADHTRDLVIPASMFDLIARLEDFKPGPAAPAA